MIRHLDEHRSIADTDGMQMVTGRRPATIRVVCRDIRAEDGYDVDQAAALLEEHQGEVVALSPTQIEEMFGIPANRINQRAHIGDICPVDHDADGRPLYLLRDLHRLWPNGGDGRRKSQRHSCDNE